MWSIEKYIEYVNDVFSEIGFPPISENTYFQMDKTFDNSYFKFFHEPSGNDDMYICFIFDSDGIQIDIDRIAEAIYIDSKSICEKPRETKDVIKYMFTSSILISQNRLQMKVIIFDYDGEVAFLFKYRFRYNNHRRMKLFSPLNCRKR